MNAVEINIALNNAVLLVDTREQDTAAFRRRIEDIGLLHERIKLNCGDYSIKTVTDEGVCISMADRVAIERKMNIDELAQCFTRDRDRFRREFERAKANNTKLYMLIEGATWENIYTGRYRTKMHSKALIASVLAWLARYNCQILFCKAETSGKLIHDILYRELKEYLEIGGEYG